MRLWDQSLWPKILITETNLGLLKKKFLRPVSFSRNVGYRDQSRWSWEIALFWFGFRWKFSVRVKRGQFIPPVASPGACTSTNIDKYYFILNWSRPMKIFLEVIVYITTTYCTRPRAGDWGFELASFADYKLWIWNYITDSLGKTRSQVTLYCYFNIVWCKLRRL